MKQPFDMYQTKGNNEELTARLNRYSTRNDRMNSTYRDSCSLLRNLVVERLDEISAQGISCKASPQLRIHASS